MTRANVKSYVRISAITIVILVITAAVLLSLREDDNEKVDKNKLGKTYSIEYELNGGTIYNGSPSSYVSGKSVKLSTYVVKEGYGFTGWYDNPQLTGERIYSIPTTMVGDVELFAGFEDVIGVDCSIYDYYSDSEYNPDGATPNPISNNYNTSESSIFQRLNTRLAVTNDYDHTWRRVQYPLYVGSWSGVIDNTKDIGELKKIIFSNGYKTDLDPDIDKTFRISSAFGNCDCDGYGVAYPGLVDNMLTNNKITQSRKGGNQRERVPLFDAAYLQNTKHMKTTYMEAQMSLGKGYTNLKLPLRRSSREGYYEFDSMVDTVRYNNTTGKLDYLGQNNEQVTDITNSIGMYPFNTPDDSKSVRLNYGYGIRVDIPFTAPYNMKVNGEDVVFDFTGDDDVWVFIDGYLALDIGGQHSKVSGNINLTQGYSVVKKAVNPVLLDIEGAYFFKDNITLGRADLDKYKLYDVAAPIQSTFDNYRTEFPQALKTALQNTAVEHKLTIFYMERAKGTSNFIAQFNMPIEGKNEPEIINGNQFRNTTK